MPGADTDRVGALVMFMLARRSAPPTCQPRGAGGTPAALAWAKGQTIAGDHDVRAMPPSFLKLTFVLALGIMPLAACDTTGLLSHPIQVRGNRVDPDQLAQLVPGTSTRNDVMALIGSPTTRATFDDNTWLYISELTKPVIGATNSVRDQQVVAITFDQQGVLRTIDRKGMADAVPVAVASRTTPSPGNESSFLQQLLGNVGRFNPGGGIGSTGPGASSSTRSNY
jgi:outer membrane protein assembly factor BamE (lipoprotein component of BamABCDE complex)